VSRFAGKRREGHTPPRIPSFFRHRGRKPLSSHYIWENPWRETILPRKSRKQGKKGEEAAQFQYFLAIQKREQRVARFQGDRCCGGGILGKKKKPEYLSSSRPPVAFVGPRKKKKKKKKGGGECACISIISTAATEGRREGRVLCAEEGLSNLSAREKKKKGKGLIPFPTIALAESGKKTLVIPLSRKKESLALVRRYGRVGDLWGGGGEGGGCRSSHHSDPDPPGEKGGKACASPMNDQKKGERKALHFLPAVWR